MGTLIRIELPSNNNRGIFMTLYDYGCYDGFKFDCGINEDFFTEDSRWYKKHHEMPSTRNIEYWTSEHYSGYLNMDVMRDFLTRNDILEFIKMGFRIFKIELKTMICDHLQGAFLWDDVLKKEDITDLILKDLASEI